MLRNLLSCPSRLPLRARFLTDVSAAAQHGRSEEASFVQVADSDTQGVRNASFQAVELHSSTFNQCYQPRCPSDVLSPSTGLLTPISTGSTESLSKHKVMTQVRTGEVSYQRGCPCADAIQLALLFNTLLIRAWTFKGTLPTKGKSILQSGLLLIPVIDNILNSQFIPSNGRSVGPIERFFFRGCGRNGN